MKLWYASCTCNNSKQFCHQPHTTV
jgi:hypothetical protein